MTDTPNPGSPEAMEAGCKCPVLDNHRGAGIPMANGPVFWINDECPLHAGNNWRDDPEVVDG